MQRKQITTDRRVDRGKGRRTRGVEEGAQVVVVLPHVVVVVLFL